MANLNGFDANETQPNNFDPLPEGKYLAAIIESEMKKTKAGDGEYLNLKFMILDGKYKGRFLFSALNLVNANKQTVDIARGQLSAICRAVKVMTPKDSIELHNLPMLLHVACKPRKDTGVIANNITAFYSKDDATKATPVASAASSETATKAPWAR